MFGKWKEKRQQEQEEYERRLGERRAQLLTLSEKELMVEILLRLEQMSGQLEEIDSSIFINSNS